VTALVTLTVMGIAISFADLAIAFIVALDMVLFAIGG
jgi:hypothetical protein